MPNPPRRSPCAMRRVPSSWRRTLSSRPCRLPAPRRTTLCAAGTWSTRASSPTSVSSAARPETMPSPSRLACAPAAVSRCTSSARSLLLRFLTTCRSSPGPRISPSSPPRASLSTAPTSRTRSTWMFTSCPSPRCTLASTASPSRGPWLLRSSLALRSSAMRFPRRTTLLPLLPRRTRLTSTPWRMRLRRLSRAATPRLACARSSLALSV
mmetsp:Transcript_11508/g.28667  ORF Transcript_11508/g.28667 Transcript_11508/m.28667 type:complete len:210 (-) Transcript_11508:3084-3713(-)